MESMTAAQLQDAFGISREAWRTIAAAPDMIKPIDLKHTDGTTKWSGQGFARWLAARHPALAANTPHLLRPAEAVQAVAYLGGTFDRTGIDAHFASRWRTAFGTLAVLYPRNGAFSAELGLELIPDADTVVVVGHGYDLYGPDLSAVDRARPELEYDPRWSDVAAHIGTRLPWWPSELRRPAHLEAWRPGDEPVPVEVVTWPAWEPLYDMAYSEAEGTAVRSACLTVGQQMRSRAIAGALREIAELHDDLDDDNPRTRREREAMVIPAVPQTGDASLAEPAADAVVREGVALLCGRTDDLALECLDTLMMWDSDLLPFGGAFSVTPDRATRPGAEWVKRLVPAPPTAAHRVLGQGEKVVGTFTDPVTGSPVIAVKGKYFGRPTDEISYHSYAPLALPTGSRVKDITLDSPVWVRTEDGTLRPLPLLSAPGVSWGYSGTGPGVLAVAVGRLLDDGNSPPVTWEILRDSDESELEKFFQVDHKTGRRFTRRKLERVRGR
ncbi:hypothetical protein ACFV4P_34490 [Kitasatospora sp. NPDC059795]|uniref:hypothetical protein n=1 Tax=Kitasatospora sp. NPDC059795 TaxID=3346949 RepID=UPI0036554DCF